MQFFHSYRQSPFTLSQDRIGSSNISNPGTQKKHILQIRIDQARVKIGPCPGMGVASATGCRWAEAQEVLKTNKTIAPKTIHRALVASIGTPQFQERDPLLLRKTGNQLPVPPTGQSTFSGNCHN